MLPPPMFPPPMREGGAVRNALLAVALAKHGTPGGETVLEGEAGFYGPKLDLVFRDALGREWQLGTIQVDYNLPERFDLWYIAEDGQRHRPVMIHRAPGSIERLVALLIEHYAGSFPAWLAPVQVKVIPISDRHAVRLTNRFSARHQALVFQAHHREHERRR